MTGERTLTITHLYRLENHHSMNGVYRSTIVLLRMLHYNTSTTIFLVVLDLGLPGSQKRRKS